MATDDFIDEFVGSITSIASSGSELSAVEGLAYLILMFAGLGIGIAIIVRYGLTLQQRPEGKYIGEMNFNFSNLNGNGANHLTAHIAESREQFTPSMANDLLKMTHSEKQMNPKSVDEFKRLLGKTFIYNANVTDLKKDRIIQGNKKAIILSNVNLALEQYHREEYEGSFSPTSASLRKYTKNVQCISGQAKEMGTPTGQSVDVYMINVISNNLEEVHDVILSDEKYRLEVNVFPEGLDVEILGTMAMFLPTLLEHYNQVENQEKEINRLRGKNASLVREKGGLYRKYEIVKDRAVRKPIRGHDRPLQQQNKGVAWGWMVGAGIMALGGYHTAATSDDIGDLPIIGNPLILGIVLMGILAIVRWTLEKKKSPDQQSNEANESESRNDEE